MSTITGTAASELLEGGAGNDHIEDREGGSDTLRGNGGNDTLIVSRLSNMPVGTIRMEGGDGDDSFSYQGYNASDVIMDGGAGADRFVLWTARGAVSITTGSGVDTIELNQGYTNAIGQITPIIVTDFSTGAGGDRLDWSAYLAATLSNWDSGNPFASGHVRLLQSGADALLQIDRDGGGNSYVTLVTFQNTTTTNFTAENLGGFPPDGSAVPGQTITGTTGDETLHGTGGNDVISGLDGNDTIYGGAGDDQIDGGAGDDTLFGGLGSDIVSGGSGNDRLEDRDGGSDTLRGNGGNDTLIVSRLSNMPVGTIRMEGGDGDDSFSYQGYNASDVIMDGGAGADRFVLWTARGAVSITTGSGVDTIELNQGYTNAIGQITPIIVTDFSTGAGGDRLDWSAYLAATLSNWDSGNPFASGHVRLLQSGADALLQIDRDGGGNSYVTLVTFQNTTTTNFTAENLGGFPPDGSAVPGQTITGTTGDETLHGTGGNDVISGLDGNDTIYGGAGDDQIDGGAGDDTLFGGLGSDIVSGGSGNDRLEDRDGGSDILRGNGGNDTLIVSRLSNMPVGTIRMEGGDGDDSFSYQGYNASDVIMDGGAGADRFVLWTARGAVSITTGSGVDTIELNQGYTNAIGQITPIIVTDFSTGAGGDRLDWSAYLAATLSNWDSGNPFASGHVRLLQSGADALLQIDRDGGGNSYVTLVTFQNTTTTNFTAENLGGFPPDVGQIITGTANDETLTGTRWNDVISGWGGNDTIDGGAGDDVISGGAGNNTVDGGAGWDIVTVSGPASAYRLLADGDNFILKGPDGGDRLTNVEAIRFADGKILDLARMYGSDVDARAWADGRIPEALLSDGAWSGERPLVLPGPAGDDVLIAKNDDAPLVLPGQEDVFDAIAKVFDAPEVLPGVDDWTSAGAKGFDLFEVLPGLDERTLFTWDPASLHESSSGQLLTVDEQGLVVDHYSLGNRGTDGWSF